MNEEEHEELTVNGLWDGSTRYAQQFSKLLIGLALLAACNSRKHTDPASGTDPGAAASATPNAGGDTSGSPTVDDSPTVHGPPANTPGVAVTSESIDVAGASRGFVLATPATYASDRTYPLVLVLHGDDSDGASIRAATAFDSVSGQDAIVAYPTGHNGWNLYDPADTDDDLAFLVALVGSLEQRFSIDPARVFGMGFSSGAFMVNQVACRRPSLFRAIVPHSGGAPAEPKDPTASKWPNDYTRCANQTMGSGPAVMVIHGTSDQDVTFDSGDFTANYWAFIDGCQTTRSAQFSPSPCVLQDGCPPSKPVVFCPVPALTHALWSEAATAAWGFFRNL